MITSKINYKLMIIKNKKPKPIINYSLIILLFFYAINFQG